MLTTIKNPKFSYARRLIALPLACILTVLFAIQCRRPHEEAKALSQSDKAIATVLKNTEKELESDSTNTGKLPDNALYIIDGIESSKKDAENLNSGDIRSMNVLKGDVAIKEYGDKGLNGVILISTQRHSSSEVSSSKVYSKVEEPATFPGGIDGWRRYLASSLRYPEAAQENGTQGVVQLVMEIDENGNVTNIKALNDPGDGLAAEAVRVIKNGPKWVPAKQNGMPVPCKYAQTLTFQLQ